MDSSLTFNSDIVVHDQVNAKENNEMSTQKLSFQSTNALCLDKMYAVEYEQNKCSGDLKVNTDIWQSLYGQIIHDIN